MFPLLREALHLLAGLFQTSFQPLLTPKGGRPRAGPHPHPVLGHPPQTHRAHRDQRGYHLGQKVVQATLVRHPEVREHVIVDGHVPPEPPVSVVLLAQTGQPAGAAHAVHGGQHPQRQQHLGVRGRPSGAAPYRLDALVEGRELHPIQVAPDGSGHVILRYQRFRIYLRPFNLVSLGTIHPRFPTAGLCRPRPLFPPRLQGRWFKQLPFYLCASSGPWPLLLFPIIRAIGLLLTGSQNGSGRFANRPYQRMGVVAGNGSLHPRGHGKGCAFMATRFFDSAALRSE